MNRIEKAGPILTLIRKHESDRAVAAQGVPDAYSVVYSGIPKAHRPMEPLVTYPVSEVIEWQKFVVNKGAASSAAGAYQIIRKTLVSLGLPRDRRFDKACQDEAALELLDQRGWARCEAGKFSVEDFADALAREWASLPVTRAQPGNSRPVKRGQSYYAGDGLNRAHATPEEVLAAIREALAGRPAPAEPLTLESLAARVAAIEARMGI